MALVEPVPFHFEMDWSERFNEDREHESTIQPLWDDTEQRRNLSEVPNRRFSYLIKCLEIEHDELQRLQAIIWGGQHLRWWAPYWPRERFLTGNVAIGGTVISVASTTHMAAAIGQGLLFYRNPSRYEVAVISAIGGTTFTVSPTVLDWKGVGAGRDKVIPCFRALMAPESEIVDHDVHLGSARVTFDLEIHED